MAQMDVHQLHKLIEKNWPVTIRDIQIISQKGKWIVAVHCSEGQFVVKGEKTLLQDPEEVCHFASELRAVLPVPLYIKTVNRTYTVVEEELTFTLEQQLEGVEVPILKTYHIEQIALALAKMHLFSETTKRQLNQPTTWSLFGGNKTEAIGDYDENERSFWEVKEAFQNEMLFSQVEEAYNTLRASLQAVWSQLPKGATQGDFCPYNMYFNDNRLTALFDFNLAGDEVLVNECIAVAVYVCWHYPYEGELLPNERYDVFIETYENYRKRSPLEKRCSDALFRIIRAFRYDRVDLGIERGDASGFLEETLAILTQVTDEKLSLRIEEPQ